MNKAILTAGMIVCTLLHMKAEYGNIVILIHIFKPLSVICVLAMAVLVKQPESAKYKNLVVGGLFLSLVGDSFLMPWPENMFIFGLASFLLAHVVYIVAFMSGTKLLTAKWTFVPMLVFGSIIFYISSVPFNFLE